MPEAKFTPTPPMPTSHGVTAAGWADFVGSKLGGLWAVYGAPGVGKTTLLAQRFSWLVLEGGLSPESILVLAATRESAATLRDRLVFELTGQGSNGEPFAVEGSLARTISSLAFAVVRRAALANQERLPELISGSEQDAVLQRLLAGAAGSAAKQLWPAQIGEVTRELAGFRSELRDLISSCQEHGINAAKLKLLARGGRPEWHAASVIFEAYQNWLAEPQNLNRFDSAGLVNRAIELLEVDGEAAPYREILVDDAQELTPSAARLLRTLVTPGVGLACIGDPDASTLGFRQANPALMGQLVAQVSAQLSENSVQQAVAAQTLVLGQDPWGKPVGTARVMSKVASLIGVIGSGAQRVVHGKGQVGDNPPQIVANVLSSQQTEIDWLAYNLRELHLIHGVPWSKMAVVSRSRQSLDVLERSLASQSVPARILGVQKALRDEFASRELLELAAFACLDQELTAESMERLLRSPFCGLDSLGLRRLRRALRRQELSATETASVARNSTELLLELLATPAAAETLRGQEAYRMRAFLKSLQKSRQIAQDNQQTIEDLLWQIWDSSGLAKSWGEAARGVGEVAVQANRNLDAVVALFASANRFVERNPGASKEAFLEMQLQQALPEDSLAVGSKNAETVSLITPAGLVGRRFDVVALPQMIEGVWPNLKPRNSLLGANLVALAAGESGQGAVPRQELSDELRMFYKAVGAANQQVLVSSFVDPDEQISQFLAHVSGGEIPEAQDFNQSSLTLRGLAGHLRRKLAKETNQLERARLAVDLGRLAAAGVAGAHPDDWYGLAEPSTVEPLFEFVANAQLDSNGEEGAFSTDRGERITINPSQLEAFVKCPLHWFLNYHGATASDFAASIGTLVHKALEVSESPSEVELWSHVESGWHSLNFESEWLEQAERRKAQKLVANLSRYLTDAQGAGTKVLAKEQEFEFDLGLAHIRGKVDRIEQLADGTVVIVDLKTGKTLPSIPEVEQNPQLGLYQLAYDAGAFDSGVFDEPVRADSRSAPNPERPVLGGAKLLLVAGDSPTIRNQTSIQDSEDLKELFNQMIQSAAQGMAMPNSVFIANVSNHCDAENEFGTCRIHLTKAVSYVE